ncbi:hypothetical protein C8A01DRAFT_15996 [Parachaetomium inaequale]|uniref:Heterokaryon incompatibility domain-containing protein n=1 Tax=Parachaetomium inaequale TaxID=2588326 RepID=A0AAN6PFQ7_9PEZI|nr:hypothetical protein C8A01DRAFT_15996 [Parachaetomium inaequale]
MALSLDTTKLQADALGKVRDLDTAKIQGNALSRMLDLADLTPETLAKTFKDVGESPEKLRALLNLWFTPWFKTSFVPDRDSAVAGGLRDVEFLGTADLPPGQLPYRMFDIETGNLVEFPAIGSRGQYCMLSHRWKGVELSLAYIKEARKKELERARDSARNGKATKGIGRKSDVQLVLEQCRLDIEEQESLITELCVEDDQEATSVNVGDLLDRRLKARAAEDNLGWAKDKEDQAKTTLGFAQIEQKIFSHLVDQMQDQVDEKMEEHLGKSETKSSTSQSAPDDVGGEVVKGAQAEFKAAEANLKSAQNTRDSVQGDINYFRQHCHLRDALDEMVCRLQRWKSAIKLDRAIVEADRIFKTKLFQHRERCYLWTDTCCIDKANGGELSESLSLMGDWYADAEYTLVQLDTRFREEDALKDWHRFKAETNGEDKSIAEKPNLQRFEDVVGSDPEWSTRAWTLQELVMSKTTFYVNSDWEPLSRPVESLGYFYYLIPFVALYTRGETRNIYRASCATVRGFWSSRALRGILNNHDPSGVEQLRENTQLVNVVSPGESSALNDEVSRVETARHLITLLDALGVRIPGNLTTETATSEMTRAVYLALVDFTSNDEKGRNKRDHFLRLRERLPPPDLTTLPDNLGEQEREEEIAQHAIKFLLQCLVAETEELILADRKYIAEFGQVQQLDTWQQGTSRMGFSAQSVLELSGKRKATVATDRSYSLMGVMGVRFPVFPAEGSVKALARLLDEVVITRNDISVFNWTGMEMGSPIRGRTMYPSSHAGYGNQADRGKRYNLLLSERVQDKMDDVVATYHSVIQTLRGAIDFLKDRERKNLPFNWIERIVQVVLFDTFRELKPQQEAFGKIVGYVREHCRKEKLEQEKAKEAKLAESATSPDATDKGLSSLLKRPTMPTVQSMPSLPSPSLSLPGFKKSPSIKKDEEDSSSAKKGSKFGLGKGIKTPSFGFPKKGGSSAGEKEAVAEPLVTPQDQKGTPDPPLPDEKAETPAAQPSWRAVDQKVMEYLLSPTAQRANQTLPPDLQSIKLEPHEGERPPTHSSQKHSFEGQSVDTISPNPIIVNNAGIEGLFDIQRVIVTMIDPDKLRRQIAKAASPNAKISGWCSISTGFARVVTSFACERRILEQELDVIESVEARVLREQDKDKGEKRGARLLKSLSVTKATPTTIAKGSAENTPGSQQDADTINTQTTDQPARPKDAENGNTEEERLVSRMIDFIQEPQLEFVAGEWVLARFSGCPGADWFLCHLELSPVPGQFYGHRIAAGAIDFHDSTPEPGLVNAWQTYMDRKKRKMCYILGDYLRSRTMGMEGEEKLKEGADFAKQGLDKAMRRGLRSPGTEKSSGGGVGEEGQGKNGEESEDESDAEGDENLFDIVLGQGKLVAKALGQYTVLAVAEKLFEMRADHLDKTLATLVLKRTPKSLRTAVENMNDNKSLLPAMFHSSTRLHMF